MESIEHLIGNNTKSIYNISYIHKVKCIWKYHCSCSREWWKNHGTFKKSLRFMNYLEFCHAIYLEDLGTVSIYYDEVKIRKDMKMKTQWNAWWNTITSNCLDLTCILEPYTQMVYVMQLPQGVMNVLTNWNSKI